MQITPRVDMTEIFLLSNWKIMEIHWIWCGNNNNNNLINVIIININYFNDTSFFISIIINNCKLTKQTDFLKLVSGSWFVFGTGFFIIFKRLVSLF